MVTAQVVTVKIQRLTATQYASLLKAAKVNSVKELYYILPGGVCVFTEDEEISKPCLLFQDAQQHEEFESMSDEIEELLGESSGQKVTSNEKG